MSSTYDLQQFAENLRQEVITSSELDGAELFAEEAFVHVVKGFLADAGELSEAEVCVHRDGGMQVHAYSFDEEQGVLDLMIVLYRNQTPPATVERGQVVGAFARLTKFVSATFDGYMPAEEATPAFDMCQLISSRRDEVSRIRLYLATDGITTKSVADLSAEPINGIPVSLNIWDIERLFKCATSGQARESIEIDLIEESGAPLPCLPMPVDNVDYRAFLAIIPGPLLFKLYERYGDRLLERNVRSYLQARGKVNRGIRETLLTVPHRFLAYNNGISATASHVELVPSPTGGIAIKSLRDLQIVNGGQTTASIYQAVTKDKADVSGVSVQCKISVVGLDEIENIVPLISRYANSQNKISEPDFSANDIFHVSLEELSRTVWTPPVEGSQRLTRWFYERARGQYEVAKTREGTASRQKAFLAVHPPQQKFTKTELAKFANSWQQRPHLVSRGGEKNFREFTIQLKEKSAVPDETYFKRLVAQAILFKKTDRAVQELSLGGYRANVVTYTVALLAKLTEEKLDLDAIWRAQDLPASLNKILGPIARKVHAVIIKPPGGANITEWCKKEQCWTAVRAVKHEVPAALLSTQAEKKTRKGKAKDSEADDSSVSMPSSAWLALAEWARTAPELAPRERNVLSTLVAMVQLGRKPAGRELSMGLQVAEKARRLGFVAQSR